MVALIKRLFTVEKTDSGFSMWSKVDKITRLYRSSLNIGTVPVIKPIKSVRNFGKKKRKEKKKLKLWSVLMLLSFKPRT